ncbi:MAG: hypothetical protein HC925_03495 [Coleofasciculaceae cyanobacterium SM2_3_26]|nr:hypothetical protein [Coleofasciculaceae cyanobacterium SM2_3_26]
MLRPYLAKMLGANTTHHHPTSFKLWKTVEPIARYLGYLQKVCPHIEPELLSSLETRLNPASFEEPVAGSDWNNCAVIAFIEAEESTDLSVRQMYLEMAQSALEQGIEVDNSPLCHAHLILLRIYGGGAWFSGSAGHIFFA